MEKFELTTLCYIERDGRYLMLHRTKKDKDINRDKYIGVGGHFEPGESPDECLKREVLEETGLTLTSYRARGIVTFVYGAQKCSPDTPEATSATTKESECDNKADRYISAENVITEYMHLYTADGYVGDDEWPVMGEATDGKWSEGAIASVSRDELASGTAAECNEGELVWVEKNKVCDLPVWEGDKIFFRLLDDERPYFSLKLVYDSSDNLVEVMLDGEPMTPNRRQNVNEYGNPGSI